MLQDVVFTDEQTPDDLVLARALLAERSPEEIASALARLYRARLPAPEDILDPGTGGRTRDDRGRDNPRAARGDDRPAGRSKAEKSSRHEPLGASVWFRANIGRKKNAEARWLLPMICRRGGIDKRDVGAIRILDGATEFEISERAAESFAAKVKRPDKEDNIRIEPLGAREPAPAPERAHAPRRDADDGDRSAHRNESVRDSAGPKHRGKPQGEGKPKFGGKPDFGKKKNRTRSGHSGHDWPEVAPSAKGGPGKKIKKKKRRD